MPLSVKFCFLDFGPQVGEIPPKNQLDVKWFREKRRTVQPSHWGWDGGAEGVLINVVKMRTINLFPH